MLDHNGLSVHTKRCIELSVGLTVQMVLEQTVRLFTLKGALNRSCVEVLDHQRWSSMVTRKVPKRKKGVSNKSDDRRQTICHMGLL